MIHSRILFTKTKHTKQAVIYKKVLIQNKFISIVLSSRTMFRNITIRFRITGMFHVDNLTYPTQRSSLAVIFYIENSSGLSKIKCRSSIAFRLQIRISVLHSYIYTCI